LFLLLYTTADQALIGYCKIIAEINRNKYVMRYRQEPRLTDKGKHDFKVSVITRWRSLFRPEHRCEWAV
jgi:hypothetical protein